MTANDLSPDPAPAPVVSPPTGGIFSLRREIPTWFALLCGTLCIVICLGVWFGLTYGPGEERILSPAVLPSPRETFEKFPSLWFDRALTRNTFASLRRVTLGFLLAVVVGVPVGVLCGCYSWVKAFFMPVIVFGRNIPIAALIPLTFALFGIGEFQKVMFIFIATVAFIIADTADAIADVSERYVDTAYTLGASRLQVILKVLVPLALPSVFNSLRLLFGLAFGYVMLAELVKLGDSAGGLGDIINMSQRRGQREDILLVLMIIPLVALFIDRVLYWVQCELFPHRYGGYGLLSRLWSFGANGLEDFWHMFFKPADAPGFSVAAPHLASGPSSSGGSAGLTGTEPLIDKQIAQPSASDAPAAEATTANAARSAPGDRPSATGGSS